MPYQEHPGFYSENPGFYQEHSGFYEENPVFFLLEIIEVHGPFAMAMLNLQEGTPKNLPNRGTQ